MTEFKKIKIQDIKSKYVINELFLYLNVKQKLNMIIYNKQLQKICGVDIKDYVRVSGKYKKIDKNGKGREYTLLSDQLIFEGEYLNKKKNGRGKEYSENKLV